jgi:fructokinase
VRIGVDLGGTKIEAVALERDGAELARIRVATPKTDYRAIVGAIVDLVAEVEARTGRTGSVGVGTPGAISPATGLMKNANSVILNGKPLDSDLAEALGRPVRLANDADCMALSEATDGAGAGARTVFAIILGTGVGGGIVADGELLAGPNAIAGEWGHNELPGLSREGDPVPDCYCGRSGCIETYLSGPGLEADHRLHEAVTLDAREIAARRGSDPGASRTMGRYVDRLARALASVINILDPHVIVLAGGVSNVEWLYEAVPARWGAFVFSDSVATPLRQSVHGDSSGVRGAAWLWPEQPVDISS